MSSVAGGASETDSFNIKCTSSLADVSPTTSSHHWCQAVLLGADGTVLDTARVDFQTTRTVTQSPNGDSGGGGLVTDGPTAEGGDVVDLVEVYVGQYWCAVRSQTKQVALKSRNNVLIGPLTLWLVGTPPRSLARYCRRPTELLIDLPGSDAPDGFSR